MKTYSENHIRSIVAKIDRAKFEALIAAIEKKGIEREYSWIFIELCLIFLAYDEKLAFTDPVLFDEASEIWVQHLSSYSNKLSYYSVPTLKHGTDAILMRIYRLVESGDLDCTPAVPTQAILSGLEDILNMEIDMTLYRLEIRKDPPIKIRGGYPSGKPLPFFESFVPPGTDINN